MKKQTKKAEGYRNVSSSWDVLPAAITPETITGFQNNIHYQGALNDLETQVFPAPPELSVVDAAGNPDEELTAELKREFDRLDCYDKMQYVLSDVYGYGACTMSAGYEEVDGMYRISEIRHLSGSSFACPPRKRSNYTIVNPLLPGIIVTQEGDVEVWQTNPVTFEQKQITNYSIIKKSGTPAPSGRAYMLPVYTEVSRIDYAVKALLQHINREGAPRVFPKVKDEISNEAYRELVRWGGEFSKNYNKDSVFVIPPGIEFPELNVVESNVAAETLDKLVEWIRFFSNPMSQMEQTGNLGASDTGRMEIWTNAIGSWQEMCELWLEKQFDSVLEANGYEGYRTSIQLKRPSIDREALHLQIVQAGLQQNFLTREMGYNTVRKELDLPEYTAEIGRELEKEAGSMQETLGNLVGTAAEKKVEEKLERELMQVTENTEKSIAEIMHYKIEGDE